MTKGAAEMTPDATRPGRGRGTGRRPAGGGAGRREALVLAALACATALSVAACWGAALAPPAVPTAPTPGASVTPAIELARIQLEGALRAGGLTLTRAAVPYRPAESPALAVASRVVFQAPLDGAPDQGRIVVYELGDPQAAYVAAREMAAYLGTGPGRIQFAPDARFALRVLGSTVVFAPWSPAGGDDRAAGDRLLTLLQTVGADVPIPSS
jgi:hypothetical protein